MKRSTKWSMAGVTVIVLIVVVAGTMPPPNERKEQLTSASTPASDSNTESQPSTETEKHRDLKQGSLRIWVPAGLTGDTYWIYLNGHIADTPPHSGSDKIAVNFQRRDNGDAWLSFGHGQTLILRDGEFINARNYISRNIGPGNCAGCPDQDASHLFHPVDLRLEENTYTIEVAYLSKNGESFPFAITARYTADVRMESKTELYAGVPISWSDREPLRVAWTPCFPAGIPDQTLRDLHMTRPEGSPNVFHITRAAKNFTDDPLVQAMRASKESLLSSPDSVILDLPSALGGVREFDSAQIRHIASAILNVYASRLPSHADIGQCRQDYPEFSQSYDEYEDLIGELSNQMDLFRAIARN